MEWKTHMKCVKRLSCMTLTEPDNDLPEYIPFSEIHDKDTDEETKFVVIFATKPTLHCHF